MLYKFPTKEELSDLYKVFPFEHLKVQEEDFLVPQKKGWDRIKKAGKIVELHAWIMALNNKWNDVAKSFVMMLFFYNQGIPDEPYYISPGRKGLSVEYFPNFHTDHFLIKDEFDFYTDVFFFKIFSALDGIWQIINVYFEYNIDKDKVRSGIIIQKLKEFNSNIGCAFEKILDDNRYKKGKEFRNSIAHRLPTGAQGSGIRRNENFIAFCINEYRNARETVKAARDLLEFSVEASEGIKRLVIMFRNFTLEYNSQSRKKR